MVNLSRTFFSCNQEKSQFNLAQKRADNFMEQYKEKFLNDTELLKYSFHPRAQFMVDEDSFNVYRVFLRDNEIGLICFSERCRLSETFNRGPLILSKGSYTLTADSIIMELSYNSARAEFHSFKFSPADYFYTLKARLKKYGVFAFAESEDKSFIKIFLSVQYYLIHSKEVQKDIHDDEIRKSYGDNWYFVKMKTPMDLG